MKAIVRALIAVGLAAILGSSAFAATEYPYSRARFASLRATHNPVLVDFTASWCTVCKTRKAVIQHALPSSPTFANFVILDVDFDRQEEAVRCLGATTQSMLIFFKDGKEVARLTGATDPDVSETMMHRAAD
ncbi:MAG: hypothetical protein GC166_13795 [Alphaproteobacteria bacterium]|nr:hypothetical protein [Alphaproteobacteria bacterium]